MRRLKSVVAVFVLLAGLLCVAEEPAECTPEHGKLGTADASPVDPGQVEVELGYGLSRSKRFWDNSRDSQERGEAREQALGLALTFGVVDNIDVGVGLDYLWVRDDDNVFPTTGDDIGDLSINGRWRFLTLDEYALEVAWITGFTIPTGSDGSDRELGTSQEFWSWDNTLALSKDWGRWTANGDIGYSLPFGGDRQDARGTFTANIAVGYQVLDWLQPELELNYAWDVVRRDADSESLTVTAGLVMPFTETLCVTTGVQQGVWGRNCDRLTSYMICIKLAY